MNFDDDFIDPHILAHSDLLSYCITQNPNYFIGNHHRVMAEKLMAVERGEIKRLVITMPPRHGKPVEENQLIQMVNHKSKRLGYVNTGDYVITHAGRPQKVLDIFEQGLLDCVEITTASGRKTIAAYDHPFFTTEGYIDAVDLYNHCCLIPVKTESYDTDRTGLVSVEETRKLINWSLENTKILRYLWSIDLIEYEYLGDKVVSVEKIGKRKCRCLAVEKDQTFLVNDLVVHNSQLASEYFVAWYLGRNPDKQVIFTTYSSEKAVDVGRNVRNQLLDPVFQATFHRCSISPDAQAATNFTTTAKGTYVAVGIGGAITGRGANCVTGDTLITTNIGKIRIDELYSRPLMDLPMVLTYNHSSGKSEWSKIIATKRSLASETFITRTESDNILETTGEHPFYSCDEHRYKNISYCSPGETLLSEYKIQDEQKLFHLQKRKNNKKHCMRRMLRRNQKYKNNTSMQNMQKGNIKVNRCLQKGVKKRPHKYILLTGMLESGQWNKKQSKSKCGTANKSLQILQRKKETERELVLFNGMQGDERRKHKNKKRKNMRSMRKDFYFEFKQKNIVFKRMPNTKTFGKNDRQSKLFLYAWRFVYNKISNNKTSNNGQRQLSMLYLPIEKTAYCSSHRRGLHKKQNKQPDYNVQFLSYNTPQVKKDKISSITRNSTTKKFVYDIEVAKNHNFFANSILIHNCLLVDDPVKGREQAESETVRSKIIDWFGSVAYTRLMTNDNAVILIMTRWHFDDLVGYAINELAHEGWHVINMPAIADEDERYVFENGDVWERKEGEPLWPEYYDAERLNSVKKTLKSRDWNSLYQQRPQPDEGGMINIKWFDGPNNDRRYDIKAIPKIERIYISADTAFKDKAINDPSAILVFGECKGLFYLLEVVNERMQYPDLKSKCISLYNKYKSTGAGIKAFIIEDKASGQSLIQDLGREPGIYMPLIPITPDLNKILRMDECTGFLEGGIVRLPKRSPWLSDFETQLERFPYDKHDDMADALSQFLKWKFKIKKFKNREKKKQRFWK